ncbi:hypothetical protein C8J56DRAFT_938859 [Mycena floridula]|nr:hypothetical protein C8J56DRAFT_938859 [Mycena floridula]
MAIMLRLILIAFLCGLSLGWVTFALGLVTRHRWSRTSGRKGAENKLIFLAGMAAGWLTIAIIQSIRRKLSFTRIAKSVGSASALVITKVVGQVHPLISRFATFIETSEKRLVEYISAQWAGKARPHLVVLSTQMKQNFNAESMLTYSRQGLRDLAGSSAKIFLTSLAILAAVFGEVLSILAKEAIALSKTLSAPSNLEDEPTPGAGADSSDEGGAVDEDYVLAEEETSGKSSAVEVGVR